MRAHDSRRSALHYAYRLLSYRSRSEAEMVRRLRMKGFDETDVGSAVLRLRESGFLDDKRLAASLKRYAEETKHLSARGARRFLIQRGIPLEISDEAVRDLDELETARRLVEKKIAGWGKHGNSNKRQQTDDTMLRKLSGILYRRGYPYGTIRKVLGELNNKEVTE